MEWLKASFLPLLIISGSFIKYLVDNSYPLISPEVWIGLCGIGLLALLISSLTVSRWRVLYRPVMSVLVAFFLVMEFEKIDAINKYGLIGLALGTFFLCLKLKENLYPVMTVVFATLLATSLALSLWSKGLGTNHFANQGHIAGSNPPPRIIHLILDEHIGIEGIPTSTDFGKAVKERIANFYRKYDFFVYGGAYSHYFYTYNAIPNVLNFAAEAKDAALVAKGSAHRRLYTNNYFRALLERNYTITAVRPDYLDVCSDKRATPQRCISYGPNSLGGIANLKNLSVSQKGELVILGYLEHSRIYRNGVHSMYRSIQPKLASLGIPLSSWTSESFWDQNAFWLAPIASMAVLDDLWGEILRAPPGNVVYAHVMLPHFPYLFKEDCSISPMEEWNSRELAYLFDERYLGNGHRDISQRREERYGRYFQQLQCVYAKLDELFLSMKSAGIFDDSIIILHGDHGSRNVQHEPITQNMALLTEDDYKDAFSTLYAIKIPGKPGGYDSSAHPLEELLAQSLQIPQELQSLKTTGTFKHFVYLNRKDGKDGEDMLEVAYPVFDQSWRQ